MVATTPNADAGLSLVKRYEFIYDKSLLTTAPSFLITLRKFLDQTNFQSRLQTSLPH